MTVPLSYLEFHVLFILPPIAFLAWLAIRREDAWWGRDPLSAVAIVCALALVYTTPWDNLLIAEGVWWYGDGAVAATIWHAPLGEYLFFVLQPVLTAFWLFQWPQIADRSLALPRSHRVLGASAAVMMNMIETAVSNSLIETTSDATVRFWERLITAQQLNIRFERLLEVVFNATSLEIRVQVRSKSVGGKIWGHQYTVDAALVEGTCVFDSIRFNENCRVLADRLEQYRVDRRGRCAVNGQRGTYGSRRSYGTSR